MKKTNFNQFEPKVINRFSVVFPEPFDLPAYVCKKTTRPVLYLSPTGIRNWENMIFEFYDPVTPSTSQALHNGIRNLRTLDSQTITITLLLLGPPGDIVEKWDITGEISKIDFGILDYTNGDPITISLFFNVHYAVLQF